MVYMFWRDRMGWLGVVSLTNPLIILQPNQLVLKHFSRDWNSLIQ